MWALDGTREKIMQGISLHPNEVEVRLKKKPSRKVFLLLLQSTKVSRIYMSEGLAKTVSKKTKEALHSAGAELIILKKRAGRPGKFGMEIKEKAIWMLNEGKTAKEISAALNVPVTSVYFWKKSTGEKKKSASEEEKFVDST